MSTSTLSLFLYLLVIISCSLILSVCFLLPVIMKAKQQKQEVLELFLSKKIEKIIDDQLKTCRWFLTKH
jgi:type III secretory pathway component EscR